MSQTNIRLIQYLYEAFADRDLATILGALSPDAEIVQSAELPWGGVYRGPDGFREFAGKLAANISSRLAIERYLDAGDDVAAIGRTQGTVNATGKPFDVPIVHLWRLQDGKIIRFQPLIDIPTMQAALR